MNRRIAGAALAPIMLMLAHSAWSAQGQVRHINPDSLHRNPAFSQVVTVQGDATTVYVGGQNSTDASGKIIGKGDLKAQTTQAIRNVEAALQAGGANLEHVVRWNVHIVQGHPIADGAAVFQQAWGKRPNPPTVTVLVVAGLANPEFLVEIDATAVVPR